MGQSKIIKMKNYNNSLDDLIEQTFSRLGWHFQRIDQKTYNANVKMNMRSWGERIEVIKLSKEEIIVRSNLKFGLVSYGKNRQNIEKFEKMILKIIQEINSQNEFISNVEISKQDESTDFVNKMTKLNDLFINDILTKEEFSERKYQEIMELSKYNVKNNQEEFLFPLIELKDKNILSDDDINLIKKNISN